MRLLGLADGAAGSRLTTLTEESKRRPGNFPSWEQLERGMLWRDDPAARRAHDQLHATQLALIGRED